jgi:hypothetical protein
MRQFGHADLARYADESATWMSGQKTEDELLQRIWNLAGDVKVLLMELDDAHRRGGDAE